MFSIIIWALLWATVVAPLVFRYVLNRYVKSEGLEDQPPNMSFFHSESPRKLGLLYRIDGGMKTVVVDLANE